MNYLDLIGIPYELGGRGEAVDCIGIVLRARERMGRPIADLWQHVSHEYRHDHFCGDRHIDGDWPSVAAGAEQEGDVVLLDATHADHCGIMVAPDTVLHTSKATGSMTTRLSVLRRAGVVHSVWRP